MKLIRSLAQKKIRSSEGLFICEGEKLLKELLGDREKGGLYRVHSIVATGDWLEENREAISGVKDIIEASPKELKQASSQQTPNQALAIVHIPEQKPDMAGIRKDFIMGLNRVQDPGNLGTIIRTADWFGIGNIVCSDDSADLYNTKVIQSTMGSFLRVAVHYADLVEMVRELKTEASYTIYGTGGEGENLYETSLTGPGMLLLGNESRGLPPGLLSMVDRQLNIPFHDPGSHPDSLNVAMAGAILCAEFRRQGV